jgi:hypothetical protein
VLPVSLTCAASTRFMVHNQHDNFTPILQMKELRLREGKSFP